MNKKDFVSTSLFEHRFWLQVLGDHARFIHDRLAPKERREIRQARHFIDTFDRLLAAAKTSTARELAGLTRSADYYARAIRSFKLKLLRRQLKKEISLGLPPSFINHMVNEVEEYLRILSFLLRGEVPPPLHPIHHHLIWLPDASGHAAAVRDNLDPVEKRLKKKSDDFAKHFEQFFVKATEMAGFLRTRLTRFPALDRFNRQVGAELILFRKLLEEIEELELDAETLSTLNPLLADHMAREECYYLIKLAETTDVKKPSCDPGKPRVKV